MISDFINIVYTHEEKIWQILTCIGLLSVVIMSCYVYNKSKDWDKEPRPEFRDVPYLRRIVKVLFLFLLMNFLIF